METNQKQVQEILTKSNLNWTVRAEPLQTTSGILLPKKIAIIRDDNDAPLGDHKVGYTPYQNHELLELLFQISLQTGLSLHTGGSFGGGEKVWFQLKSDDLRLKNDKIEGYISGFNSFDGSTALSFGNSNKTVSCQNSFWLVYRSMTTKMKHSVTMRAKIEEVLVNIDKLVHEEQDNFRKIERLADVRMSAEVKEMVIRKLFDLTNEEKLDSDDISTNKKHKLETFYLDLNGELQTKEDSLWGLFSGVTKYTTHSMKKTDNTENKIFGAVGKKEREIWNSLVALV
jgi:phage/plasmid-like protein (TIGR03299 family)